MFKTSGTGYEPTGEIKAAGDDAIAVWSNVAANRCLLTGLLCNDSQLMLDESRWKLHGDPTEGALIAVAGKAGLDAKSMFEIGLFSNHWIGLGVASMLVLPLAFADAPFMNRIFHSAPIGWDAWWRIVLTGLATYAIVGIEKWVRRRREARIVQEPSR